MSLQKRRNVMKAFVESEFGYCPLIWTFHGNRSLNNCMNKLNESALRLVYRDYDSTYESLLLKDGIFYDPSSKLTNTCYRNL